MGRELQKKKNRSSVSKVKSKRDGRTKAGKKKVNFLGNAIIAENWDRKLTMSQNYKRLGLSSRLNSAAGGVETQNGKGDRRQGTAEDSLAIPKSQKIGTIQPEEVRVDRDPETGHIIRIIRPESHGADNRSNPLNDPLNDITDDGQARSIVVKSIGVVAELEAQAVEEAETLARTKRPRQQSQREEEWIKTLVERHGDNIMAMVRDRKLNPMQQTEGDITKRVRIWTEKQQKIRVLSS